MPNEPAPEPGKTALVEEPEPQPSEPSPAEISTPGIETSVGRVEVMRWGAESQEGDSCSVLFDAETMTLNLRNRNWSGHTCDWPKGDTTLKMDSRAVEALQSALSGFKSFDPAYDKEPIGYWEETLLRVEGENYNLPAKVEEVLLTQAQRLLK